MNHSLYRLIAGFKRFREKYFLQEDADSSIYTRLSTIGQNPKTLLIGCSDSRVDPAILTGASPGDIFVIRNVANLVPPCETSDVGFHGTSSAIEFAVLNLKVENVIILGHRQCGGIRALMSREPLVKKTFISQWMNIVEEVHQHVHASHPDADDDTRCRLAEMESIRVSLRNLRSFPFVEEAIASRNMNVIGVYFDLEQGQLWHFDDATQAFVRLPV
ncbi:carbonic anhydrase [soil metagenome]